MSDAGTDLEQRTRSELDDVRAEFSDDPSAMAYEIWHLRYCLRQVRRFTSLESRAGQWARAAVNWRPSRE